MKIWRTVREHCYPGLKSINEINVIGFENGKVDRFVEERFPLDLTERNIVSLMGNNDHSFGLTVSWEIVHAVPLQKVVCQALDFQN